MSEHQVTKSGNCVIEGCPCRGWSAQEGVRVAKEKSMNTNETVNALREFGEVVEQMPSAMKDEIIRQDERERLKEIRAATHQPAARGGGDEWRADDSNGWGYVWQGGACLAQCPEPSRAQQIVTEHNQHQSLVAERERLITALQDCIQSLSRLPDVGGAYRVTTMKSAARTLAEIELNAINDQKRGTR